MPSWLATHTGSGGVAVEAPSTVGIANDLRHSKGDGTEQFSSIAALGIATEAALTAHTSDATIHYADAPADGNQYARKDNTWEIVVGGGGGEANTSSNAGGGAQLALAKSGVDLPFRTLVSGDASVSFTQNATELDIRATGAGGGETNTSSNQGGFVGLAMAKNGVDLPFRTLQSTDTSVVITQNADNVNLTASAASVGADAAGSAATVQGNLDSHTGDGTIHFTVGSIDHTAIQNVGTNTHAQIDSHITTANGHIADGSIHFTTSDLLPLAFDWTGAHSFTESVVLKTATIALEADDTITPTGTTAALNLANGQHKTIVLGSATGTVTLTLTPPAGPAAGTISIEQGATPRNIVIAFSGATTETAFQKADLSADAANSSRVLSWVYRLAADDMKILYSPVSD